MTNIVDAIKNLFNPSKAEGYLAKELPKASFGGFVVNLAITYAFTTVAQLIGMVISLLAFGVLAGAPTMLLGAVFSVASLTMIAFGVVIGIVLMLIFCGILHLIAKAFGGRGTFMSQLYLQSVTSVALAPINFVFIILMQVPVLSCIVLIPYFLLLLYMIYLLYLLVKVAYKLDSKKAAYTMVAYVGVMVIIVVLLTIALLIMYGASLMALANQGSMPQPL
ncbi:MAG: YIP1 family protein [Candidatus ainarchaeum sp.]|nr:YIP1 family protein [Candidatus ainarchaeum sp.]